jgi:hypothetical protein
LFIPFYYGKEQRFLFETEPSTQLKQTKKAASDEAAFSIIEKGILSF